MKGKKGNPFLSKVGSVGMMMEEEDEDEVDEEQGSPGKDVAELSTFDGLHHVAGTFSVRWCAATGLIASGCKDGSVGLWRDRSSVGVLLDGHCLDDGEDEVFRRAASLLVSARRESRGPSRRATGYGPCPGRSTATCSRAVG